MTDIAAEAQRAMAVLAGTGTGTQAGEESGTTSDLSIDEVLLLHGAGWESAGMVFGVSWWSIPWGAWQWQRVGEVDEAAAAFSGAFDQAVAGLRQEATDVGATGVVGVNVEFHLRSNHMDVALTGTAISPIPGAGARAGQSSKGGGRRRQGPFASDLSVRDFVLLERAGWEPLDIVAGASFVVAPRRSARAWAAQQGRNTELTNLTTALYQAREQAMETMQQRGMAESADGVVAVKLREGPLGHMSRVVEFVAVGTAVRLGAGGHQSVAPQTVVPLDEKSRLFQAASLRNERRAGRR